MGFVYKNFKQIMLVTILLLCSGCVSNTAISQNIDTSCKSGACSWKQSKEILQQFVKEGSCERYWNIIWPHAKSGNLEARAYLFSLMLPRPHTNHINAPDSNKDSITQIYHLLIMAIYSDAYEQGEMWENVRQEALQIYKISALRKIPRSRDFFECVEKRSKNCEKIAVQKNLIPSFKDYARKIDALINAGFISSCIKGSRVNIEGE